MKPSHRLPLALSLFLAQSALDSSGSDWPQWRGPSRDGTVMDPVCSLQKLPGEPKLLWEVATGPGQSSPVILQDRLVFMDGIEAQETAHCVDAASGRELWRVPVGPMVEFQNAYGEGPRCTPLIDGDRVYVQSCGGEFKCLALSDGRELWAVSFSEKYGATWFGNKGNNPEAKETASRRHGNNGSAAVDGDRVFVPVGSPTKGTLVAFDKKNGRELWAVGSDNTAYSSVMVGTLCGVRQVIHFTADALMGVAVDSGKLLWREPLKTGAKRHVATPVLDQDTVTVTSTSIGLIRFQLKLEGGEWKVERLWENARMKVVISSPVQVGANLYSPGPGNRCELVCVDAASGDERWKEAGLGDYASITAVNDALLVLDSTGELRLVHATPAAYEERGRSQVVGKTWSSPAFANGVLYAKDANKLVAIKISD